MTNWIDELLEKVGINSHDAGNSIIVNTIKSEIESELIEARINELEGVWKYGMSEKFLHDYVENRLSELNSKEGAK